MRPFSARLQGCKGNAEDRLEFSDGERDHCTHAISEDNDSTTRKDFWPCRRRCYHLKQLPVSPNDLLAQVVENIDIRPAHRTGKFRKVFKLCFNLSLVVRDEPDACKVTHLKHLFLLIRQKTL